MRLLLDTQILLWSQADPRRLGATLAVLEDERNDLIVSAASAWELAIKVGLGKLTVPAPVAEWFPSRTAAIGAVSIPVSVDDATAVATLPEHHRDPFDRLLVVQAQRHGLRLVTADRRLDAYEVDVLPVV